ncbi:hypothetical protein N7530_009383 [Penicillium desertorum]|uniref:Uncharacterized protein n=1 Tax=Penicillium desertorum TaxID=1303715 RepID=A0A9X0BIB8_9EURO|nr:hypothetical protein N7530_009383 [Penicillium desertorum]
MYKDYTGNRDIFYNIRTKYLINRNGNILRYIDISIGILYLISPKEINYNPNEIDSDSNLDNNVSFINKVIAYEVYYRLGYTGKAYIASTL